MVREERLHAARAWLVGACAASAMLGACASEGLTELPALTRSDALAGEYVGEAGGVCRGVVGGCADGEPMDWFQAAWFDADVRRWNRQNAFDASVIEVTYALASEHPDYVGRRVSLTIPKATGFYEDADMQVAWLSARDTCAALLPYGQGDYVWFQEVSFVWAVSFSSSEEGVTASPDVAQLEPRGEWIWCPQNTSSPLLP